MSKNRKQSTVNGRLAWAAALCSVPTSSIFYLFFWCTLSLRSYDVPDSTFDFYGFRTFFPHNTRRSHKIGQQDDLPQKWNQLSNNKAPLRMCLLAHDACTRCIFVYEGAVKALPAHHLRRHHGRTVIFVSDFGQQKLFHLKPGSITYHWKALFLKETNMPVKWHTCVGTWEKWERRSIYDPAFSLVPYAARFLCRVLYGKWKSLMSGIFLDSEKNPVPTITECKSWTSGYFSDSKKNLFFFRTPHMTN